VLPFVIAAIATTSASISATILDDVVDKKGSFLPKKTARWLTRGHSPSSHRRAKRWRRTLNQLVLSFDHQQLVTGFALIISGYWKVWRLSNNFSHNAHWTMVVYLSFMSSSSHLAGIFTLSKYLETHKGTRRARIVAIVVFSVLLVITFVKSTSFSIFTFPLRALLAAIFLHGDWSERLDASHTVIDTIWKAVLALGLLYI
jgi:hypothetical protein